MPRSCTILPEDLGALDACVVRCIAGEFDRATLMRNTQGTGADVMRRMQNLVTRHAHIDIEQLRALSMFERHRIANDIVIAASEFVSTMPGALAPLRKCDPDSTFGSAT
jgi:hypothetical protein